MRIIDWSSDVCSSDLAAPDCDPNLVVIIADDGREFFDAFRKDRPTLFHALELSEIRDVRKSEGPVRAWQIVELRGSDGRKPRRIEIGRASCSERVCQYV